MTGRGYLKDDYDPRDFRFVPTFGAAPAGTIELAMPAIYDQGQTESCVSNSVARVLQYFRMQLGLPDADKVPSRLMLHRAARLSEGPLGLDTGIMPRSGLRVAAKIGTCFETGPNAWPFDPVRLNDEPPGDCYTVALADIILRYERVDQDIAHIRAALAAKQPIIFGTQIYESFETGSILQTGVVTMPTLSEVCLGGHCEVITGDDPASHLCRVDNSWGESWGPMGGRCLFPYDYLIDSHLVSDIWTVSMVGAARGDPI